MHSSSPVRRLMLAGLVAGLLGSVVLPVAAADATYHVIDLGRGSVPKAINVHGDIVGTMGTSNDVGVWHADTQAWTRLRRGEMANAINDAGVTGGAIYSPSRGTSVAARWSADGHLLQLPAPSGYGAVVWSVANDGRLTGNLQDAAGVYRAAQWQDGTLVDLGCLPNAVSCFAKGASPDGDVVVGSASDAHDRTRAVAHLPTGWVDLGSAGGYWASAEAVNRHGHVVGWSLLPTNEQRAFAWWGAGHPRDLGLPAGARVWAAAYGINAHDVIVGTAQDLGGVTNAVIWRDGQAEWLLPLTDAAPDWRFNGANAIAADGRIVGSGVRADGFHGFLLVPMGDRATR